MTSGEWNAVLQFLEESNNRGRELICRCSQCNGTYVKHRAYINSDGDFVLSQDTLNKLLDDFKCTKDFEHGLDKDKWGYWFAKYDRGCKDIGWSAEEHRNIRALVKKEYTEDDC